MNVTYQLMSENLLTIDQLVSAFPRRNGRFVSEQAVWLNMTKGVFPVAALGGRGPRVKLESVKVGRRRLSSIPAVRRFLARINGIEPPTAEHPA
ncbi:MAG TPA: DUF1580 domain-containing protein [Gemmataceae bacterium]|nr:DUF1580 domain-containing protein [Gemmataceae bacterium]